MSDTSDREPIEPPGGFEPKNRPDDLSAPELRPDWLTGADDGLEFGSRPSEVERPTLLRPGGGIADPSSPPPPPLRLAVPPGQRVTPEPKEESLEPATGAWAPAASSIPRLTVVPQRERPSIEVPDNEDLETLGDGLGRAAESVTGEGEAAEAGPVAPEEPWWLVAFDTLTTNRLLQMGIAAVLVLGLAWTFWPRKENQTTAISAIKQHPQRFEGQAVRIRGEVGEVFDVGSGVVFELHQRRDTLVVFSPNRRPALHDRLVVQGTVSTGYLDGTPRVALFEAPGAPTP